VIWDVLDTDVPRPYQYTYDCWMRSMRVHVDWERSGGLTRGSRLFLGLHPCMIADVFPNSQDLSEVRIKKSRRSDRVNLTD
jgi:hypothetical protein